MCIRARPFTWVRMRTIDHHWYTDTCKGIEYVIKNQRARALDLLLAQSGEVSKLLKTTERKEWPLNNMQAGIAGGSLLAKGVAKSADLKNGIMRAREMERRLVFWFLLKAGPNSVWTRYYANMHNSEWPERAQSGKELTALFQEMDHKFKLNCQAQ